MTLQILHRGRFRAIEGAAVRTVAPNSWEVSVPVDHPIHRTLRRAPTPEGWDGAVFLVDDVETEPGMGSGVKSGCVCVTVWVL